MVEENKFVQGEQQYKKLKSGKHRENARGKMAMSEILVRRPVRKGGGTKRATNASIYGGYRRTADDRGCISIVHKRKEKLRWLVRDKEIKINRPIEMKSRNAQNRRTSSVKCWYYDVLAQRIHTVEQHCLCQSALAACDKYIFLHRVLSETAGDGVSSTTSSALLKLVGKAW